MTKNNTQHPAAVTPLTGAEVLHGVQSGIDVKIIGSDIAALAAGTPDATTSTKGKVQLAGDLGGTAGLPTVPGLAAKAADSAVLHKTGDETFTGKKKGTVLAVGPTNIDALGYGTDGVAINQAITDLPSGGGIVHIRQQAEWLASTSIDLRNRIGVVLRGDGMPGLDNAGTRVRWNGSAGGWLVDMSGARDCRLEDLSLFADNVGRGGNSTQKGVVSRADAGPGILSSQRCELRRVYLQNFGVAVELGSNIGEQVDTWTLYGVRTGHGTTGIGLHVNSVNAVENSIIDCCFDGTSPGTTSKGIWITNGDIKVFKLLTLNNKYGVYFDHGVGVQGFFGLRSEGEGYVMYLPVNGNHQKAFVIEVSNAYAYESILGSFYFGDANVMYDIRGFRSETTMDDTITVPDNPEEVFLHRVTNADGVKNVSGASVEVPGWYGQQGVSKRPYRLSRARFVDHMEASGGTPTVTAVGGAGTSPPSPIVTGNDTRGEIQWGTGTGPSAGGVVNVVFATPFATAPVVVITPLTDVSDSVGMYVGSKDTTQFFINTRTAPTASQSAGTYAFSYMVMG